MIEVYYLKTVLPVVQKVARECGYAIGVHGSLKRDFDLIAAPWVEDAAPALKLVEEIVNALKGSFIAERLDNKDGHPWPTFKPHGRLAWSIRFGDTAYIDLSIMPRKEGPIEAKAPPY